MPADLATLSTALITLAQTTAPSTAPGAPQTVDPPAAVKFLRDGFFYVIMAAILLFLFMGKKGKTDDKKRTDRLANLGKGDQVQTIGGIIGTVTNVDGDVITVKVDESTNTKLKFSRTAIHRVLTGEETAK